MESRLYEPDGNLMESGKVIFPFAASPLLIYRGMRLLTSDGSIAGFVAAVIVDADTHRATHLLLIRRCPQPQYQLVSVESVAEIAADTVRLRLPFCDVERLPAWHNNC